MDLFGTRHIFPHYFMGHPLITETFARSHKSLMMTFGGPTRGWGGTVQIHNCPYLQCFLTVHICEMICILQLIMEPCPNFLYISHFLFSAHTSFVALFIALKFVQPAHLIYTAWHATPHYFRRVVRLATNSFVCIPQKKEILFVCYLLTCSRKLELYALCISAYTVIHENSSSSIGNRY